MGLIKKVRNKRTDAYVAGEVLIVDSLPAPADRAGYDRALAGFLEHYGATLAAREPLGLRYTANICGRSRAIILAACDARNPARYTAEMNELRETYRSQFTTAVCSATPTGPANGQSALVACHLHDHSGLVTEYNHKGRQKLLQGFGSSDHNRSPGTSSPLFEQGDVIVPAAPGRAGSSCMLDLYASNEIEAVTDCLRDMFRGRSGNRAKPMMACLDPLTGDQNPADRFEALARVTVRPLAHAVQTGDA